MRQEGTVELSDELKIKVKELTVNQVFEIYNKFGTKEEAETGTIQDLIDQARPLFDMAIEGIEWKELPKLAPSEIKLIYDQFKEVNSVFFAIVQALGLNEALDRLRTAIKNDFIKMFLDSSSEDISTS